MRKYLLITSGLALLVAGLVFAALQYEPEDANAVAPTAVSSFAVISPDNIASLTPVVTFTRGGAGNYDNELRNPVWSPDGRHVAVLAGGPQEETDLGVWVYDVFAPETPPQQFEHDNAYKMTFSPDGSRLATLSDTGYVGGKAVVWNIATGEQLLVLDGANLIIRGLHFNRDGTQLITDDTNNLWSWDIATGENVYMQTGTCSIAFNQDVTLAAGSDCEWTGVITVYDLETGQQVRVGVQDSLIAYMTLSPDGNFIAASDNNYDVHVWGLSSDAGDLSWSAGDSSVGYPPYTRFSPDRRVLAWWMRTGGTVYLQSAITGDQLAALEGHFPAGYEDSPGGTTLDVAFSPNGDVIVTFWGDYGDAEDDNLRLWDVASGELVRTIADEYGAAFSPDGTMLATDSPDGSVKIWAVGA